MGFFRKKIKSFKKTFLKMVFKCLSVCIVLSKRKNVGHIHLILFLVGVIIGFLTMRTIEPPNVKIEELPASLQKW